MDRAVGQLTEEAGQEAHQQRGDKGPLADAFQMVEEDEAQQGGADGHGHIHSHFGFAEVGMPAHGDGVDGTLAGEHDHIGSHLHVDAEAQHHTADQQRRQLERVGLGIDPEEQRHGQVNKGREHHGHRHLEPVGLGEALAQHDQLQHDEQQAEIEGKHTQGRREADAQYIGIAGDRRGPQVSPGNQGDSQGVDKQPHQEEHITTNQFCFFHTLFILHPYSQRRK